MNHYCHLPFTRNMETRPPEINSDWPAKSHHGGVFAVFSSLVGRIYFALATSSCWYCPNDSDVEAECLRTQAWVSHGVSCFWNHILAWNVTSLTSVGPFRYEQVSSGDHFLSVYFSHVYNSGLCASHLVNCCHCGYWGMVHWLCIWNSQANFFPNHCWYVVLLKTVINFRWW